MRPMLILMCLVEVWKEKLNELLPSNSVVEFEFIKAVSYPLQSLHEKVKKTSNINQICRFLKLPLIFMPIIVKL